MAKSSIFAGRTLKWLFDHQRSRAFAEFMRQWVKALRKALNDYVKHNCRSWYGAAFSKRNFSFNVVYRRKTQSLFVWGAPPNENVGKKLASKPTVEKLPQDAWHPVAVPYSRTSRGADGVWHRKPVADGGARGFTFTAKTRQPRSGERFFMRGVYAEHLAEGKGAPKLKFTYPAAFALDGTGGVFFLRQSRSISDIVMRTPAFSRIARETFDAVVVKNAIPPTGAEEILGGLIGRQLK